MDRANIFSRTTPTPQATIWLLPTRLSFENIHTFTHTSPCIRTLILMPHEPQSGCSPRDFPLRTYTHSHTHLHAYAHSSSCLTSYAHTHTALFSTGRVPRAEDSAVHKMGLLLWTEQTRLLRLRNQSRD
ncbi:hypothetical protein J4Q44_G00316000 [Coregonus suidteri]|uniref:Uncharacterized protein n=1 Tax=Coregonus suidteri TaxID=861788 RepID=A0AAN8L030_9TELE